MLDVPPPTTTTAESANSLEALSREGDSDTKDSTGRGRGAAAPCCPARPSSCQPAWRWGEGGPQSPEEGSQQTRMERPQGVIRK